jgi:hypothetical protein
LPPASDELPPTLAGEQGISITSQALAKFLQLNCGDLAKACIVLFLIQ